MQTALYLFLKTTLIINFDRTQSEENSINLFKNLFQRCCKIERPCWVLLDRIEIFFLKYLLDMSTMCFHTNRILESVGVSGGR